MNIRRTNINISFSFKVLFHLKVKHQYLNDNAFNFELVPTVLTNEICKNNNLVVKRKKEGEYSILIDNEKNIDDLKTIENEFLEWDLITPDNDIYFVTQNWNAYSSETKVLDVNSQTHSSISYADLNNYFYSYNELKDYLEGKNLKAVSIENRDGKVVVKSVDEIEELSNKGITKIITDKNNILWLNSKGKRVSESLAKVILKVGDLIDWSDEPKEVELSFSSIATYWNYILIHDHTKASDTYEIETKGKDKLGFKSKGQIEYRELNNCTLFKSDQAVAITKSTKYVQQLIAKKKQGNQVLRSNLPQPDIRKIYKTLQGKSEVLEVDIIVKV